MKTDITAKKEAELKTLSVQAGVRYWEDSDVDGVSDEEGNLIPCRENDCWCPEIDIDTGKILNWKQGVKAELHYKVCDDGVYIVKDSKGNKVLKREGYVPDTMCPAGEGFGDYIIMSIDENGQISGWKFDPEEFEQIED